MIALRVLRRGATVREAVFRELPVTLGRGEEAGFPLADASVSRLHARLERDASGALVLRDLGSRNGLHVGPRRVESVAVVGRLRCLVGAVELEIESIGDDMTEEIRLHDWRRLERRRGPRTYVGYWLLGTLGWLAAVLAEPAFWSPWDKGRGIRAVQHALGALVLLPVVATVLLVLLRALGRRVRLADTLGLLAGLVWLLPLSSLLAFLAYYVLPTRALSPLAGLLAVATAAWAAASLAVLRKPRSSLRVRAVAAAAAITLAAGYALTTRLRAERSGQPELDFQVQLPLAGYAGRAASVDDYFAQLEAVSERAAEEAAGERTKSE